MMLSLKLKAQVGSKNWFTSLASMDRRLRFCRSWRHFLLLVTVIMLCLHLSGYKISVEKRIDETYLHWVTLTNENVSGSSGRARSNKNIKKTFTSRDADSHRFGGIEKKHGRNFSAADSKINSEDFNVCKITSGVHNIGRFKLNSENNKDNVINRDKKNVPAHKVQHVVFSKVHKCASTSVMNILARFTLARNLSAMLPTTKVYLSHFTHWVSENDRVPNRAGGKDSYDMLFGHIIFNKAWMSQFYPSDTAWIAIVREPMKQAVSSLRFYTTLLHPEQLRNGVSKHPDDPINGYIDHPEDFAAVGGNPVYSHVNNRMSIDLGISRNKFEDTKRNQTKVCEFVQQLDADLDLVLIADYFDESLILMRRLLNWQLRDILYVKVNELSSRVRRIDKRWFTQPVVTPENLATFRKWAAIDYALYYHFAAKFWRTIEKEDLFNEELEAFREILRKVDSFCSDKERAVSMLTVAKNEWTEEFSVSEEDCSWMSKPEWTLVDVLRNQQLEEAEKVKQKGSE